MSADDTIVTIMGFTSLTQADIDGLRGLELDELKAVLDAYTAAGKVSDRGAWVRIGNVLKESAQYLPIATGILQVVGAVAAL